MKDLIDIFKTKGELTLNNNSGNSDMRMRVEQFLDQYRFLTQYPEYIMFLKEWSGLLLIEGENSLSFYGFDNDTLDLVNGEGELIDEKGFLTIGDYTYYDEDKDEYLNIGFGIDATGKRETGIYSYNDDNEKNAAGDFNSLLNIIITDFHSLFL